MSRKPLVVLSAGLCLAFFTQQASAHDEPVAGTLVGAGIGAAVAGPPGAAVGAVIGAIIGATAAHQTDHGPRVEPRHHHSRAQIVTERRHVHTSYYANGNGNDVYVKKAATVYCEPVETTMYRPKIVHRDDRPNAKWIPASTTAPKPKVKKVCRYVQVKPAKNVTVASR